MHLGTLGFLVKEDKVLLAMKKRGFGKDWFNGFGGKLEPDESFEASLVREAKEEINVTPTNFEKFADLVFYDNDKLGFLVKAYIVMDWEGEPSESEEMKPEWFNKNNIPFERMWEDDPYWLPKILKGRKLEGHFYFKNLFDKNKPAVLLKHEIIFLD